MEFTMSKNTGEDQGSLLAIHEVDIGAPIFDTPEPDGIFEPKADPPGEIKTVKVLVEMDEKDHAKICELARENNLSISQTLVGAALKKIRNTPTETRLLFQEMVVLGHSLKQFGKQNNVAIEGLMAGVVSILDRLNALMARKKKTWEDDI